MAPTQIVLSTTQLNTLQTDFAQLGRQNGVRFVILADLSGQDISYWDASGHSDVSSIAALAAGDLMATLELGRMLGGKRTCNLIVQEHEEQTIVIGRVGQGLLLLMATARDVPLGWSRLTMKRMIERILSIVGTYADTPPPPGVTEEFESQFAAQINAIW